MSLCTEWSIVKHLPDKRRAKPLYCRSWNCETCRPRRKRQLMALCAAGSPSRFITLTVNPRIGSDPHGRLLLLSAAWRNCLKRLRRARPNVDMSYLAIVEETKAGEPHLHILFRGPYIPQAEISSIMQELIDSPIVDIRKIKGSKEVIRYVAKYVTKAPAQFNNGKRYWRGQNWDTRADDELDPVYREGGFWQVSRHPLARIWDAWKGHGFRLELDESDGIIAYITPAVKLREVPHDTASDLYARSTRRQE